MEEIVIEGKHYLSSRRAAEEIGYSQDYVTHLAREGMLDARMVEGLWFISRTALDMHRAQATMKAEEKAEVNHEEHSHGPATLVSFDGREYVSTARAANTAGFTPDYIAQLAREGTVPGRQVGNRWYVDLESVIAYKNGEEVVMKETFEPVQESRHYVYEKDDGDVMPKTKHHKSENSGENDVPVHVYTDTETDEVPPPNGGSRRPPTVEKEISIGEENEHIRIPIRIQEVQENRPVAHAVTPPRSVTHVDIPPRTRVTASRRVSATIPWGSLTAGAALTIVIIFSLGLVSTIKNKAIYAARPQNAKEAFAASVEMAFKHIGDVIETKLVPEMQYTRAEQ